MKTYAVRVSDKAQGKLLKLGSDFMRRYLESLAMTYKKCTSCGAVTIGTNIDSAGKCRNCS